jgi:ABC-type nickel/cobalt efflux system permease component RcnA
MGNIDGGKIKGWVHVTQKKLQAIKASKVQKELDSMKLKTTRMTNFAVYLGVGAFIVICAFVAYLVWDNWSGRRRQRLFRPPRHASAPLQPWRPPTAATAATAATARWGATSVYSSKPRLPPSNLSDLSDLSDLLDLAADKAADTPASSNTSVFDNELFIEHDEDKVQPPPPQVQPPQVQPPEEQEQQEQQQQKRHREHAAEKKRPALSAWRKRAPVMPPPPPPGKQAWK